MSTSATEAPADAKARALARADAAGCPGDQRGGAGQVSNHGSLSGCPAALWLLPPWRASSTVVPGQGRAQDGMGAVQQDPLVRRRDPAAAQTSSAGIPQTSRVNRA
jgi:hypothetical protein